MGLQIKRSLVFVFSSGMDPAGPGFQGNTPMATPMSASDASNVVAIVTDGMFFGMASPNCTTVYLNGGGLRLQPRCKDLTSDFCGKNECY